MKKTFRRRDVLVGASLGLAATVLGGTTAQASSGAITLSPVSGPIGTTVTVTGTGFPKKAKGTVTLSSVSAAVTTSASGYLQATLTVPSGIAGTAYVSATVGAASAQAPFSVAASATVPPPNLAHPLRFGVATLSGYSSAGELNQVASLVGEGPSIVHAYCDWTTTAVPTEGLAYVASRGATPLLTWEPWNASTGGTSQPAYALNAIYGGAYDSYIAAWANGLKAYGGPVLLRFAHEMNGNWYPWSEQVKGNAPGDYAKAFRHVRDVFSAIGVPNVQWVWCPNVPYAGSTDLAALYPGDAYADLVGLDGYNWGTTQSWGSTWVMPDALFGEGLSELAAIAPSKQALIAEVASAEQGGDKAAWNQALIQYLSANASIMGFAWFDLDKEVDWRIDSSSTSASAFASALALRP
ncbi:glycoside hydrolase family 26 protein [Sinomonas humi]|uniref:GH26 domain-containing protein n=1 Tax=Sinomonas humi TaxID=1338436 RepID=A0A0B2APP7_9MICC|nr:glycosyl hydrolase [Sinomonas humi]KHL03959.1 hypothetical protein LK10_07890 [Sinomonas humi]